MNTRLEAHFGDRVVRCFAERPGSLYQLLADATARDPAGEALVADGERLSWTALAERSAAAAAGLAARGVGRGERLALLLGNHAEFVVALFAAARLGAVAVPLNIREQKPELAYILGHCGARLVVHEPQLAERLPPGLERVPRDRFAELLEDRAPAPAPVAEEDTAAILYTSGTTGRPKGAMLSHLGIVHSALHYELGQPLTALSLKDRH